MRVPTQLLHLPMFFHKAQQKFGIYFCKNRKWKMLKYKKKKDTGFQEIITESQELDRSKL